jgi:hypothetical protein
LNNQCYQSKKKSYKEKSSVPIEYLFFWIEIMGCTQSIPAPNKASVKIEKPVRKGSDSHEILKILEAPERTESLDCTVQTSYSEIELR